MARAAFGLYLVAIVLLPVKWGSPFSHEQAGLTDLFIAGSAGAWAADALVRRRRPRLGAVEIAGAAYVGLSCLSALVASDRSEALLNAGIVAELAVLAVLTADFAADRGRLRTIGWAVAAAAALTVAGAAVALGLFYAGVDSDLVEANSAYFSPSDYYTRVSGGFFSGPLLGSFCVMAAAVVVATIPRPWAGRLNVGLALTALATLSRAFIAFVAAAAIRRRPAWSRAIVALAIGVVALLSVVPMSANPARPTTTTSDTNPRVETVSGSFDALLERPLLGHGPGALTGEWQGRPFRAHLTPLNVAATTGIPALLALMALLVALWRRAGPARSVALWSGMAGIGIDALGQDVEHFRHVWILIGLVAADGLRARAAPRGPRQSPS